MALPKIEHPLFDLTIPSTQQRIQFRPFLVKEEKILLVAQQADTFTETLESIMQILHNCIEDDVDLEDLALFDIEYIFVQLRSKSVNNIAKLIVRDPDAPDGEGYPIEINLDTVEVSGKEDHSRDIEISPNIHIRMKYPTIRHALQVQEFDIHDKEANQDLLLQCIDVVFAGDETIRFSEYPKEEQKEWIENFNLDNYKAIRNFFNTMPRLRQTIEYGEGKSLELEGLRSFFTLG